MSKLARIPINIKDGVSINFENDTIKVTGPKGSLSFGIPKGIGVESVDRRLLVSLKDKDNENLGPSLGLARAMIANMITGVTSGFEKKLELSGVGYRAQVAGNDLNISVGFSHPIKVTAPEGLIFTVAENIITVAGINKDLVGNMAAQIRFIRPPEPYKGKGIKYVQEVIRRKVGKAAKTLGVK